MWAADGDGSQALSRWSESEESQSWAADGACVPFMLRRSSDLSAAADLARPSKLVVELPESPGSRWDRATYGSPDITPAPRT